jgi:hypothetical protein
LSLPSSSQPLGSAVNVELLDRYMPGPETPTISGRLLFETLVYTISVYFEM